jgi:hypothetical protein
MPVSSNPIALAGRNALPVVRGSDPPQRRCPAEWRLNRQFFATHLPHRTTRISRHGRITERLSPCFPGYLFLLLDLAGEAWKSAAHTRGVLKLLPISDAPIAVRAAEVIEATPG